MNPKDLIDTLTAEVLKALGTAGIPPDGRGDARAQCRRGLDTAASNGRLSAAELAVLTSKLAQVDVLDSAIRQAAEQGDRRALETLAALPPDRAHLAEPLPRIFTAIEDSDPEAVRAALCDWEVNAPQGAFGRTALYAAMSNMFGVSLDIVTLLLDAGADPRQGLTDTNVLHGLGFAQLDGIPPQNLARIVTRCVALGADLEERSRKLGWTPLHTALTEWNDGAVEALLIAGADPDARTGAQTGACLAGQSCLEVALGRPTSFGLLLAHGADPAGAGTRADSLADRIDDLLAEDCDSDLRADLEACRALLRRTTRPK